MKKNEYTYTYQCPYCGQFFETNKNFSEIKTCKNCGYKFVSSVLFEE